MERESEGGFAMTFNAKKIAEKIRQSDSWIVDKVYRKNLPAINESIDWDILFEEVIKALEQAHAAGLAQGRNEALEEAAKEVESLACGIIGASPEANNAIKGYIEKHISMCVRALKTPDGKEKSE